MAALDASVRKGEKVAENDVVQVTELLMNELLKLDAVVADGDVKAQRRMQVNRLVILAVRQQRINPARLVSSPP